jgi:hypothetical protein
MKSTLPQQSPFGIYHIEALNWLKDVCLTITFLKGYKSANQQAHKQTAMIGRVVHKLK